MSTIRTIIIVIFAALALNAATPNEISWQGVLKDDQGNLLNGNYTLDVKLYNSQSGGSALWSETHNVTIDNGNVNLILGSNNSLNLDFDQTYWLEITVDSGTPLDRVKLTSVPYSMRAKTVPDNSLDFKKLKDAQVSGSILKWNGIKWEATKNYESDPFYTNDPAFNITSNDITNWNDAYSWGDHSQEGYLTSYSESDPTWSGDVNQTSSITREGRIGLGIGSPNALIHTNGTGTGEGNILFEGEYKSSSPGDPPAEGSGTRMMWYPDKAAFRAGIVTSDQWDKDNIGLYSFAAGSNTKATGDYSIAMGRGTEASGYSSTAMGFLTDAASYYSTAIGRLTTASGNTSTAMGRGTEATGGNSTAMGRGTEASGNSSTAMGYYTTASSDYSSAMGFQTTASGDYSTAMGFQTTASGNSSTAMGYDTEASGSSSTAMGDDTEASGNYSTSMGLSTGASGNYSTSMGRGTGATGDNSTAMGSFTTAPSYIEFVAGSHNDEYTPNNTSSWNSNDRLFVIGNGTSSSDKSNALTVLKNGNTGIGTTEPAALVHTNGTGTGEGNILFEGEYKSSSPGDPPASGAGTRMMWYPDKAAFRAGIVTSNQWNKDNIGLYSFAAGVNTKATDDYSTAMGFQTTASGNSSTAMGDFTEASGNSSTTMGSGTTASGNSSTAMGYSTEATGDNSTAMGYLTNATGKYSTAMSYYTTASGDYSSAMGFQTKSSGNTSTAMGDDTEASGNSSTAMGDGTKASGNSSTAMGDDTEASGYSSTAMGNRTEASGDNSTSMGLSTEASGYSSTAMGFYTTAPSYVETVIGSYNTTYTPNSSTTWNSYDRLFVIGNGSSFSDKSNALTVLKNGRIGLQDIVSPTYAFELPNDSDYDVGKARAYAWVTYSDGRLKSDRNEISYGLKEIMEINPVKYFHHHSLEKNGKFEILDEGTSDIGFIAQDIYKIIPELVTKPEDDTSELWGMNYEKLTPVLVKAVQQQQEIIEEQKNNLDSQENEIKELRSQLNSQNEKIEQLEKKYQELIKK